MDRKVAEVCLRESIHRVLSEGVNVDDCVDLGGDITSVGRQQQTLFINTDKRGRGLLPKVNMGQGTEASMYAQDIKEATQLDANGSSMFPDCLVLWPLHFGEALMLAAGLHGQIWTIVPDKSRSKFLQAVPKPTHTGSDFALPLLYTGGLWAKLPREGAHNCFNIGWTLSERSACNLTLENTRGDLGEMHKQVKARILQGAQEVDKVRERHKVKWLGVPLNQRVKQKALTQLAMEKHSVRLLLLIIQGSVVWMQGEKFQGEVQQNCVAIADSVVGQIVFIFKFQDLTAMPQEQADVIVKLIMDVDHHLPVVVRGKNASTLNGYMKCTLDRHSCCGGDFGRSKAEREDPAVSRQVLRIMQEEIKALRLAFPVAMMDIYSR
ncbi:TPA: hypothetical protein ACH3X1_007199 [Trebouxia sp. C0004]